MSSQGGRVILPGEQLHGKRLFLRLVTIDDCTDAYVDWLNDPEVNHYLETGWSVQTLKSIRTFVDSMLSTSDNYLFAIVLKDNLAHIGNVKIGPINRIHLYADLGYFIGTKEQWRKGFASEAIGVAVDFAFVRLGLHRVQAGVNSENSASRKVLLKVGFSHEGALRKKLKSRTGKGWDDNLLLGMLKEEWMKRPQGATS